MCWAGHSIAWTLYFLTKHPEVMAALEAELDAAGLLFTPQRPQPRQFTYADIGKLPYLDAVIKARLAPSSPAHILGPLPACSCSPPGRLHAGASGHQSPAA